MADVIEDAFDRLVPWAEFNAPRALWDGMLEIFRIGWNEALKQKNERM